MHVKIFIPFLIKKKQENNFYIIKNIDSNLKFSFNNQTKINIMPQKYINLIKKVLKNNQIVYNCNALYNYIENKKYETFFCENNAGHKDIKKIKLNINTENYNKLLDKTIDYLYKIFIDDNCVTIINNEFGIDLSGKEKNSLKYFLELEEDPIYRQYLENACKDIYSFFDKEKARK